MLHSRERRVGEQIKEVLAQVIMQDVQDPRRPKILTITDVTVAKDMRHAKVHYSQLPDDDEALARTEEMIADSIGFLRSRVAEEINLRITPDLHFAYDPSQKNYQRINTLLHGGNPDGEPEPKKRKR